MAKIGLKNLKYSILKEEGGIAKYSGAKSFGKAIECKVSIEKYEAELYADDTLAESDYTFKKGSISLTVDEDDDIVFAEILGHEVDEETNEMVRKDTDVAPYIGIGRILTKIVNGAYKYKVEFLPKVKFSEPEQEESTKGDSIEFKTPTIEGAVVKLSNGIWSKSKTFTDLEEAVAYLDDLMKSE
jgi:phi13 family phage major tail protein